MMGAKTPNIDCKLFGIPSDYHLNPRGDTYYGGLSGWGVKDGSCILGECSTFGDCYSLYASIYYECVYSSMTAQDEAVGVCQQREWTAGLIQQKCEVAEGRKPSTCKAWSVDANGNCIEVDAIASQCSTSTQCSCPVGQVASCQQIQGCSGTVGRCICLESPDPVITIVCGDGRCDAPSETFSSCATDCHCGNSVCEAQYGESFLSCTSDCSGGGGGGGEDNTLLLVLGGLFVGLLLLLGVVGLVYLAKKKRGGGVLP
jgi:hypothetical protein